ncbi:MAG: hypothetical protein K6U74_18135 [Firmicutes bacterium]|nr:hypothetical protein [Bacillota bacterium]
MKRLFCFVITIITFCLSQPVFADEMQTKVRQRAELVRQAGGIEVIDNAGKTVMLPLPVLIIDETCPFGWDAWEDLKQLPQKPGDGSNCARPYPVMATKSPNAKAAILEKGYDPGDFYYLRLKYEITPVLITKDKVYLGWNKGRSLPPGCFERETAEAVSPAESPAGTGGQPRNSTGYSPLLWKLPVLVFLAFLLIYLLTRRVVTVWLDFVEGSLMVSRGLLGSPRVLVKVHVSGEVERTEEIYISRRSSRHIAVGKFTHASIDTPGHFNLSIKRKISG